MKQEMKERKREKEKLRGETNRKMPDEPQWIVAQRLLSALTAGGQQSYLERWAASSRISREWQPASLSPEIS